MTCGLGTETKTWDIPNERIEKEFQFLNSYPITKERKVGGLYDVRVFMSKNCKTADEAIDDFAEVITGVIDKSKKIWVRNMPILSQEFDESYHVAMRLAYKLKGGQ
jgi:hypothetical protein